MAITHALLRRLGATAKFEEKDKKKLEEFSDLCADVDYQIEQLPGLACLNYPNAMHPIVQKLPLTLRAKWEKKVVDFALKNDDAYPSFHEFSTMIQKQAQLKNHPNISCKGSLKHEKKKPRPWDPFNENTALKGDIDTENVDDTTEKHCLFHDSKGHTLHECRTFGRKTLQERTEWIQKSGHCFRCLSDKYIAKECKTAIKCKKCGSGRHIELLHLERRKEKEESDGEEIKSSCTLLCNDKSGGLSCNKIVLLDISLLTKPDQVRRIYAILDEQSNASMISPALADMLEIDGEKEKHLLSTCSRSREVKYGRRVPGLIVTPINGKPHELPTLTECSNSSSKTLFQQGSPFSQRLVSIGALHILKFAYDKFKNLHHAYYILYEVKSCICGVHQQPRK